MKTISATLARSDLFNILKNTISGHTPVKIASKSGNVILISEDDFESIVETAELLSEPGLLNSIKKADEEIQGVKTYSMKEVFGDK